MICTASKEALLYATSTTKGELAISFSIMAGEEEKHQKWEPWIELDAESRRCGPVLAPLYISRHEFYTTY